MRKFQVTVNGHTYEVEVEEVHGAFTSSSNEGTEVVQSKPKEESVVQQTNTKASGTPILAPMPGKIVDVRVRVGKYVNEGDLLMLLEAMKMENEIFASQSGIVESIGVTVGAMVETNQVLLTVN